MLAVGVTKLLKSASLSKQKLYMALSFYSLFITSDQGRIIFFKQTQHLQGSPLGYRLTILSLPLYPIKTSSSPNFFSLPPVPTQIANKTLFPNKFCPYRSDSSHQERTASLNQCSKLKISTLVTVAIQNNSKLLVPSKSCPYRSIGSHQGRTASFNQGSKTKIFSLLPIPTKIDNKIVFSSKSCLHRPINSYQGRTASQGSKANITHRARTVFSKTEGNGFIMQSGIEEITKNYQHLYINDLICLLIQLDIKSGLCLHSNTLLKTALRNTSKELIISTMDNSPRPSADPDANMLNTPKATSGQEVYRPEEFATHPTQTKQWERAYNPLDSPQVRFNPDYRIPKADLPPLPSDPPKVLPRPPLPRGPPPSSYSQGPKRLNNNSLTSTAKGRQLPSLFPDTRGKTMTKFQHVQWIATEGLNSCKKDLHCAQTKLDNLLQDYDTMESQLIAVGVMRGHKAQEKARKDAKTGQVKLAAQIEQAKLTVFKYKAALGKMQFTHSKLSQELEANRRRRREIRQSKHYAPSQGSQGAEDNTQYASLPQHMTPQKPVSGRDPVTSKPVCPWRPYKKGNKRYTDLFYNIASMHNETFCSLPNSEALPTSTSGSSKCSTPTANASGLADSPQCSVIKKPSESAVSSGEASRNSLNSFSFQAMEVNKKKKESTQKRYKIEVNVTFCISFIFVHELRTSILIPHSDLSSLDIRIAQIHGENLSISSSSDSESSSSDSSSDSEEEMNRKTKANKAPEAMVQSPPKQARQQGLFDPNITDVGDDEAPLSDSNNNEGFSKRQQSPTSDTPRSSEGGTPAGEHQKPDEDGSPPIDEDEQQREHDRQRIRSALEAVGGLQSSKAPDLDNIQQRVGQQVEVIGEEIDFDEDEVIPQRPAEHTLRRLTREELAPPPSNKIIPLDLEEDPDCPSEFVANQRIELLVMKQPIKNKAAPWGFPDEKMLQSLFDAIRQKHDHAQIMDVALWCRVDKKTTIASMMLSTVNLPLFKLLRHAVRNYMEVPDFRFETYIKSEWVSKYGHSMYIPRDNANMNVKRILRTLFYKYPNMKCKLRVLTTSTFTDDPPNKLPGQRSRIGDKIVLMDGDELSAKLKPYPEDFRFAISAGFSVTIRGGLRGNETGPTFERSFAQAVIVSAANEAGAGSSG